MIAFYPIVVALVVIGSLGVGRAARRCARCPRLRAGAAGLLASRSPRRRRRAIRIWPLWYVALAFYHNKLAGGLFVLGLVVEPGPRP